MEHTPYALRDSVSNPERRCRRLATVELDGEIVDRAAIALSLTAESITCVSCSGAAEEPVYSSASRFC